jgi:UDP-GlcNAc3NAcA epimerase
MQTSFDLITLNLVNYFSLNYFLSCWSITIQPHIISAFNTIAQKTNLVLPLHPRTKAIIEKNNIKTFFKITEPVGYFDMLELLKNCKLVITDSGGLQKEAFYFHKQCITIRKQTEWIELLQGGFCCLSEPSAESIFSAYEHMENKKRRS